MRLVRNLTPILITFLLAGAIVLFLKNPLYVSVLVGAGRVLHDRVDAEISVNGIVDPDIACFRTESLNGAGKDQMLVLYSDQTIDGRATAVIVNLTEGVAGLPNSGPNNYIHFSRSILLQSESGALYVPFSSAKFDHPKDDFRMNGNRIEFSIPLQQGYSRVEILLKDQ